MSITDLEEKPKVKENYYFLHVFGRKGTEEIFVCREIGYPITTRKTNSIGTEVKKIYTEEFKGKGVITKVNIIE